MGHIFISCSHKDTEYVHRLQETLENEGFEVWIDDRIHYGSEWPKIVTANLDTSDGVIVVLSTNSYESDMVQNEVTRAREKKKDIFPLLLEGENWLIVQAKQFVDVRDGSLPTEKFYERLERVTFRKKKEYTAPPPHKPEVAVPTRASPRPKPPVKSKLTPAPASVYTAKPTTPIHVPWGLIIGVLVILGIIVMVAFIHANSGNNLVTGGLTTQTTLASGYSYFNVWVKNNSISPKYVAFEATGRWDDGTVISDVLSNTSAPYFSTLVEPNTQKNFRVWFDFSRGSGLDSTQNVTITSCYVIVGDNATAGYNFDTSSIKMPCSH